MSEKIWLNLPCKGDGRRKIPFYYWVVLGLSTTLYINFIERGLSK